MIKINEHRTLLVDDISYIRDIMSWDDVSNGSGIKSIVVLKSDPEAEIRSKYTRHEVEQMIQEAWYKREQIRRAL